MWNFVLDPSGTIPSFKEVRALNFAADISYSDNRKEVDVRYTFIKVG